MAQPYQLIREIQDFEIIDFIPHLGWIAPTQLSAKIYTASNSSYYFLHDENSNRLFEFSAEQPNSLNSSQHYWEVIAHFRQIIPELFKD